MPIRTIHPLYKQQQASWQLCRDAAQGETQVKEQGIKYLPRPVGMTESEYQSYKLRARFFGGPARTIDGMLGQMFRKSPILSGAVIKTDTLKGERGEGVFENLTPEGLSLNGLARYAARELLTTGRLGLLADLPSPALPGAAAYLAPYEAEAILSWESSRINGKFALVSVVLQEQNWVKGGDPNQPDQFILITHRRHLGLSANSEGTMEYFQQLYTQDLSELDHWRPEPAVFPEVRGKRLSYIPFVFLGVQRGFAPAKPPILEVCHAAMSYYRSSADYENALYFAGNPTPIATGIDVNQAEPLRMGSSQFNAYANPDTKVFLLELSGKSVTELRENLHDKKAEIALLGLRMLEAPKLASESAANQAMRQEGEKCYLATLAEEIGERLSLALAYWAELSALNWAPQISLNQDYRPGQMPVTEAVQLAGLVEKGFFPRSAYVQALKTGELLPPDYQEEEAGL